MLGLTLFAGDGGVEIKDWGHGTGKKWFLEECIKITTLKLPWGYRFDKSSVYSITFNYPGEFIAKYSAPCMERRAQQGLWLWYSACYWWCFQLWGLEDLFIAMIGRASVRCKNFYIKKSIVRIGLDTMRQLNIQRVEFLLYEPCG